METIMMTGLWANPRLWHHPDIPVLSSTTQPDQSRTNGSITRWPWTTLIHDKSHHGWRRSVITLVVSYVINNLNFKVAVHLSIATARYCIRSEQIFNYPSATRTRQEH